MIKARLDGANRALTTGGRTFLRPVGSNSPDQNIFAEGKWSRDGNVVFAFHNLWKGDVAQAFWIDPSVADQMAIDQNKNYQLVDVISGKVTGKCLSGTQIRGQFPVFMDHTTLAQWLRLEICTQ